MVSSLVTPQRRNKTFLGMDGAKRVQSDACHRLHFWFSKSVAGFFTDPMACDIHNERNDLVSLLPLSHMHACTNVKVIFGTHRARSGRVNTLFTLEMGCPLTH